MIHLAIFASGRGTNAEAIINYFRNSSEVRVALLVCNTPEAEALQVAERHGIPAILVNRDRFYHSDELLDVMRKHQISFIVLAGFLWLIPKYLLETFPSKIVNVHPALLPRHGGKGMYGKKVHEAVLKAKEKESGITVHYVNENFDEGEIIFQAKCKVEPGDDAASLEARVRKLEYAHYPKVIEKILTNETANV